MNSGLGPLIIIINFAAHFCASQRTFRNSGKFSWSVSFIFISPKRLQFLTTWLQCLVELLVLVTDRVMLSPYLQVGTLSVTNHTLNYSAELEFQPASWFTSVCNQVVGKIYKRSAASTSSLFGGSLFSSSTDACPLRVLFGNWTKGLFSVDPRCWDSREDNTTEVNIPVADTSKNSRRKDPEVCELVISSLFPHDIVIVC